MKSFITFLALLCAVQFSYAQWNTTGSNINNTNTGNVGVGTTTPVAKLDVNGNQRLNGDLTFANDQTAYLIRGPYNGGAIRLRSNSGAATDRDVRLGHVDNSGTWTSYMVVGQDGNTGIGTDVPLSLFQVDDDCSKANIGDAGGQDLHYGTSYLGFNAARAGSNWTMHTDGLNNGGGVAYSDIFGNVYIAGVESTGGSNKTLTDAQIASRINFKVTPTAAYAKQMYVQTTGFPDYVFHRNYRLRPLAEVKAYVDQYKHLPEIPAAAEVEKDGINLGEMNKLLLKKVEELTLYLIEKDKQIQNQQTISNKQKSVNDQQQKQLDELKRQMALLLKTKR